MRISARENANVALLSKVQAPNQGLFEKVKRNGHDKSQDESADRNKNDVKRRVHIDIKPCVFLQDPHRQHVHEINPIRMLGNERQKRTFQLDIF